MARTALATPSESLSQRQRPPNNLQSNRKETVAQADDRFFFAARLTVLRQAHDDSPFVTFFHLLLHPFLSRTNAFRHDPCRKIRATRSFKNETALSAECQPITPKPAPPRQMAYF